MCNKTIEELEEVLQSSKSRQQLSLWLKLATGNEIKLHDNNLSIMK